MSGHITRQNRTTEDHVASKNLDLPAPELERPPVEKIVEEKIAPLLALDRRHAEPKRERVNVNRRRIVTDAPQDLFGFPRRLLLALLLIHCEHAKHHTHGPLTNHHRPKQAQALSDAHEHDVVHQHEIDDSTPLRCGSGGAKDECAMEMAFEK